MVSLFRCAGFRCAGLLSGLVACAALGTPSVAQGPENPLLVVQNGAIAATESGLARSKVCDTRGNRTTAGVASLWTITVSASGGSRGHGREQSGRTSNATYTIPTAPRHGQITQKPTQGITYIVYTPAPGYKGPDNFVLRQQGGRSLELPYAVNVVPRSDRGLRAI